MDSIVIFVAALLGLTAAFPAPNPLQVIEAAGPAAGIVIKQCASPGQLALAYDDGPFEYTQQLSDILSAGGAKGTFFFNGDVSSCIYDHAPAIQSAYEAGHQIASHTWSHPSNLDAFSDADVTSEMQKVETALVNIIGVRPTYMRPPFLNVGGNVLPMMKTLGYRVITSAIDTEDWNGLTPAQSEAKFTPASVAGNGPITLMHETYQTTVETLTPWLIGWAKQNGLKLVTVAECLGDTLTVGGAYANGTGSDATTC